PVRSLGHCPMVLFRQLRSRAPPAGATADPVRRLPCAAPAGAAGVAAEPSLSRCDTLLALTHDLQHATRFAYYRCRYGHGRLTPFFQFLREKNFVRPLDPAELERLKASVRTIRCASCGAPVDIERSTVCRYCQAPIMALDPDAVEKALPDLDAAERQRVAPDP